MKIDRAVWRILILLDCVANFLLRGSITETLSARAHRMRVRKQPVWGWTADAIDAISLRFFHQPDHCLSAWRQEQIDGSALYWAPRWLFTKVW